MVRVNTRKCDCGEPIFRADRDCCDSCFNTGIRPQDELHMVIEYYSYNANPKPEGIIGLSMDDIQYHKEVKEWCCQDMKEKWGKEVGFSHGRKLSIIKYNVSRPNKSLREYDKEEWLSLLNPSGDIIKNCPYCNRPIKFINKRKDGR